MQTGPERNGNETPCLHDPGEIASARLDRSRQKTRCDLRNVRNGGCPGNDRFSAAVNAAAGMTAGNTFGSGGSSMVNCSGHAS